MIIDTHCHLNSEEFKKDLEEVVDRAWREGVKLIIVPGYTPESNVEAIRIANKYSNCFALIGIHPDDSDKWNEDLEKDYRAFLSGNNKIVGVGEVGLDYHWDKHSRDLQKKVFAQQIKIANDLELPVVVHSRAAEYDCLATLKENEAKKAVFHCFGGSLDVARDIWSEGYYTSFTGIITYKKSEEMREVVFHCPEDKIMIETDAPYLAPQSVRGQRCEPSHAREIFEKICEIRSESPERMEKILEENSRRFFGLPEDDDPMHHQVWKAA